MHTYYHLRLSIKSYIGVLNAINTNKDYSATKEKKKKETLNSFQMLCTKTDNNKQT